MTLCDTIPQMLCPVTPEQYTPRCILRSACLYSWCGQWSGALCPLTSNRFKHPFCLLCQNLGYGACKLKLLCMLDFFTLLSKFNLKQISESTAIVLLGTGARFAAQ